MEEDVRTPVQKMRIWGLRDLAKQRGLHNAGYDIDNMTKDQILQILGAEQYRPQTRPLTSAEEGPLESYEPHGLLIKAYELGIPYKERPREELIELIKAAQAERVAPIVEAPAEPAAHSVEALREAPEWKLKQLPKWQLEKLAKDMGVVHQAEWTRKDFLSAISEKRANGTDAATGG